MANIDKWREEARKRGFNTIKEWLNTTYDSGISVSQLAGDIGLSKTGAHKLLKRFGVNMRPKGGPNR